MDIGFDCSIAYPNVLRGVLVSWSRKCAGKVIRLLDEGLLQEIGALFPTGEYLPGVFWVDSLAAQERGSKYRPRGSSRRLEGPSTSTGNSATKAIIQII